MKSVQADPKKGFKSSTARLPAETLKKAHRNGLAWEDSEVEVLVKMIQDDDTTFDMALSLGRSYYSAQYARSHVGFALRHASIFKKVL